MKLLSYLVFFIGPWLIAQTANEQTSNSPRFADEIANFEAQDKANPPPQNALLISGSSSARLWTTAAED